MAVIRRLGAVSSRATVVASLSLLLTVAACAGDGVAPTCSGPVEMEVSNSLPPLITWTPDCGVASLVAVAPPSLGVPQVYWAISAGQREIESGVRYGRLPRGAVEESPPAPIPSGARIGIQVQAPRGTTIGSASWVAP
jgi:hypothetical protein